MSALPDQADRDAAVKDTASSILVEASAGTGKTTTLVNRVLELALADELELGGGDGLEGGEDRAALERLVGDDGELGALAAVALGVDVGHVVADGRQGAE